MAEIQTSGLTRKEAAATLGLTAVCLFVTLAAYYTLPVQPHPHVAIWWRLLIAIAIFVIALSHELNAILRHRQPMRRAMIALAVLLPLFVVIFAWIYLTLSRSDPLSFTTTMTRTKALYFTITILSTVGFGDITPKTDPARIATAIQMVSDLILFAVVIRLILGAASRAVSRRSDASQSDPAT